MNNPVQLVENYISASIKKASNRLVPFFLLAMMAGAFIAIGGTSSSLAAHAVANPGLAKFLSGCIFPIGLMMIVFVGGELFTGDCMMILGVMDHKITVKDLIVRLLIVFIGNLLGSVLIAVLVSLSGQWDMSSGGLGAYTIKVACGKTTMPFIKAFCSGILCNVLVCVAVLMGMAAKDAAGKVLSIFFPIMAFVTAGFEHCVANMYYIPAGMLAALNPAYTAKAQELYGLAENQLAALNSWNMFAVNLLPVTLGNIVGGMLLVSVCMYLTTKDARNS